MKTILLLKTPFYYKRKFMKRLIAIFYIFILSLTAVSAQEYGTHFLREVWASNLTNPGLLPRQTFVLALPSTHVGMNVSDINADLFALNSQSQYVFNAAEIVNTLDSDISLDLSTGSDVLGIGFRLNKFFFSVGAATQVNFGVTIPEDMIRVAWNGTAPYLDQSLDLGPDINLQMYQELSVGVNYMVNRNFGVGARIKRLGGITSINTVRSGLNVTHSSDIYQANFEADYAIDYAGMGARLTPGTATGIQAISQLFEDAFSLDSDEISLTNVAGSLNPFSNRNVGYAFDIGAEYNWKDKVTVAASILDIGSINWDDQVGRLEITEDFTFDGVDFAGLALGNGGTISADTFQQLITVNVTEGTSFSQKLPTKTYLSATVKVLPILRVGALIYNEFGANNTKTSVALNGQLKLGNIFQVGAVYAYKTGSLDNIGANIALKIGPGQIYFCCR